MVWKIISGTAILAFLAWIPAFAQVGQSSLSERQAVLSQIRGPVEVRIAGSRWQSAQLEMTLREKDEIRTGNGGFAEILLDRGGSSGKLELKAKSHLLLTSLTWDEASGEKSTFLDLAIGKVLVHAEKLKPNSKFEIRTPTATTGVRGTVFEVSVEER